MSTKIYNGLISNQTDPFETGSAIRRFMEQSFMKKFEELHELFTSLPEGSSWSDDEAFLFDRGKVPDERTPEALYEKILSLNEQTTSSLSDADICYEVSLIKNMVGENPLVLVFGEKSRQYSEELLEVGLVSEFGYWDNSDAPDDIGEEEWEMREAAWGELLKENKTPFEVELGISYPTLGQCIEFMAREK